MSTPSPREALAQRLRGTLGPQHNVREVRMFGGLSFMVDEQLAISVSRDGSLLVRVAPAEYDKLLQRGGEPAYMGNDRPMGSGWLTVPSDRLEDDEELAYWVNVGIESRNAQR